MKKVLWIDDDVDALTGLHAYLYEVSGLGLEVATSAEEALSKLDVHVFHLLLFDMVLMDDSEHASLHRKSGMKLAEKATDKNVRLFVAYTVLSEVEVRAAWERMGLGRNGTEFTHFPKGNSAVKDVVSCITQMLELES